MGINKIVKYNLESRAQDLKVKGKSLNEIATILSDETKQDISKSNVYRYFESNASIKASVVEKREDLRAKVVEVEISTIEDRQKIIKGLLNLASSALEDRDRVAAYKVATEAIDSLDKRIGKLTNNQGVTINNINAAKFEDLPLTSEVVQARHAFLKAVADARSN